MDNLFWPFGIFAVLTGLGLLIDKYQNRKQTSDWERIKNSTAGLCQIFKHMVIAR
jgi:hypothetical protein